MNNLKKKKRLTFLTKEKFIEIHYDNNEATILTMKIQFFNQNKKFNHLNHILCNEVNELHAFCCMLFKS